MNMCACKCVYGTMCMENICDDKPECSFLGPFSKLFHVDFLVLFRHLPIETISGAVRCYSKSATGIAQLCR